MAKVEENKKFKVHKAQKGPNVILPIAAVLAGAGILIIGYILFFRPDPLRARQDPEQTLMAYSSLVLPMIGQTGLFPQPRAIDEWLTFFDPESRDFFRNNTEALSAFRMQTDRARFETMSPGQRRAEAMREIINRPPLGGIARVGSMTVDGDRASVRVQGAVTGVYTISMRRVNNQWVIEDFAGHRATIENDIARFRPAGATP